MVSVVGPLDAEPPELLPPLAAELPPEPPQAAVTATVTARGVRQAADRAAVLTGTPSWCERWWAAVRKPAGGRAATRLRGAPEGVRSGAGTGLPRLAPGLSGSSCCEVRLQKVEQRLCSSNANP